MATRSRPLSPHLQIYRWQISNTLSILHRLSGAALSIGFALLAAWIVSVSQGPDEFAHYMHFLSSPIGIILMAGMAAAFVYHFLNGIRHLLWDAGIGLEKHQSRRSGWVVVFCTALLLLALLWWLVR